MKRSISASKYVRKSIGKCKCEKKREGRKEEKQKGLSEGLKAKGTCSGFGGVLLLLGCLLIVRLHVTSWNRQ